MDFSKCLGECASIWGTISPSSFLTAAACGLGLEFGWIDVAICIAIIAAQYWAYRTCYNSCEQVFRAEDTSCDDAWRICVYGL
jgi:hypothetical protein